MLHNIPLYSASVTSALNEWLDDKKAKELEDEPHYKAITTFHEMINKQKLVYNKIVQNDKHWTDFVS